MYTEEQIEALNRHHGILQEFRAALAWGMVYGPILSADDWERMRDQMADQFTNNVLKLVDA